MCVTIQLWQTMTPAHQVLLLTADPSEAVVAQYLPMCICFDVHVEGELAGVMCLLPHGDEIIEIKNIAVVKAYQGQGIAQALLRFAIQYTKERQYEVLEIATGSTSFQQLYLYQKVGFRIFRILPDFFVMHYPTEIVENGLILRDLLYLRYFLQL